MLAEYPLKLDRLETMEYLLHLKEKPDYKATIAKVQKYAHYQGWNDICIASAHSHWTRLWELYKKEVKKEINNLKKEISLQTGISEADLFGKREDNNESK